MHVGAAAVAGAVARVGGGHKHLIGQLRIAAAGAQLFLNASWANKHVLGNHWIIWRLDLTLPLSILHLILPGGNALAPTLASFTWLFGFSLLFESRFSVSVLWSMSKVLLMVTLRAERGTKLIRYLTCFSFTISDVYYLRYLILLASLMASFASTDGDGSLTMDLSNESSSLSLSDKPLLTLHNDTHRIQNIAQKCVRNTKQCVY